jgi:hypothetical protein
VDLNVFCELVDLFTYYPKKPVKQHPGRGSSNIYRVMSSNIKDGASADKPEEMSADQSSLKRNLEFIWLRIDEKFPSLSKAYRFFDVNYNNRVTFNEFSKGLELLKVKMNLRDQLACFKYLDADDSQYLTYDEFCGLTVERRSNIDPLTKQIQARKQASQSEVKDRKSPSPDKDLDHFLGQISMEDLFHLHMVQKSSKKLDGGPNISGKKAESGQIKKGYSVPKRIFEDTSLVYGQKKESGTQAYNMKDILHNKHLKDSLIEKFKATLIADH